MVAKMILVRLCVFFALAISMMTNHALATNNWKSGFIDNYVESCLELNNATPFMVQSFTSSEIKSLCQCAANYVADNLTEKDFTTIFRSNSFESSRHLVEIANNTCSKALLEKKGLLSSSDKNSKGENLTLPLYARPPISNSHLSEQEQIEFRQRVTDQDPLASAFVAGAMTAMGTAAEIGAGVAGAVGLSNVSRGLTNTANQNFVVASRKPTLMNSSAITTTRDTFTHILANFLYLFGLTFIPGLLIYLVRVILKARTTESKA